LNFTLRIKNGYKLKEKNTKKKQKKSKRKHKHKIRRNTTKRKKTIKIPVGVILCFGDFCNG
jgi:hypothetical protein